MRCRLFRQLSANLHIPGLVDVGFEDGIDYESTFHEDEHEKGTCMDIEEMIKATKACIASQKESRSMKEVAEAAERTIAVDLGSGACQSFDEAIARDGLSVICEVCTPSANSETTNETCIDLGYEYDAGDADAVSFVGDPRNYKLSGDLFVEMRDEVSTPILRHDLMIDAYQICVAKCVGADAITLMEATLTDEQLREYLALCEDLHMAAVVEAWSMEGLERAVTSLARIVSVNFDTPFELVRQAVPDNRLLICAHGVQSTEDAQTARDAGFDAVIAGSFLLQAYEDGTLRETIRKMRE